jgi:sec-independent protein translocase protein TatB
MDVGFWELIIILVVGLLVVGPNRLPEVARTVGRWTGRARAFVNSVKNDVDRELRAQELRDMMQPKERDDIYEFVEEAKKSLDFSDTNNDAKKDSSA